MKTTIKLLRLTVLFLLSVGTASGAITQVQTIGDGVGSSTSFPKTFASNVTAGNFIVALTHTKGQDANIPTDSLSNSYSKAICVHETSQVRTSCIFYAMNIAGGADTVTVTQASADEIDLRIAEYSGIVTTSALDKTATGTSTPGGGASTAPLTGNTTTTCQASELLVSITSGGSQTYTAGTGYTLLSGTSSNEAGSRSEDQIVSSTGTYSAAMTLASSTDWAIALATFKASGGTCSSSSIPNQYPRVIG